MRYIKLALLFIMTGLLSVQLVTAHAMEETTGHLPQSVISNFAQNAATTRNFSWFTSDDPSQPNLIEYCTKSTFKGFDKDNILKVTANDSDIETEVGARILHKVELSGLTPDTGYVYRVGNDTDGYSAQGIFKTTGLASNKFTFIDITDTQGTTAADYNAWRRTLDKALAKYPNASFTMLTGDLVDSGQSIRQWDMFANAARQELLNMPLVPVVGNHDAENFIGKASGVENFTERFDLPQITDTGAADGTVYSFDCENAHIAVMNTECGKNQLQQQADWLCSDMTKSNKLWKIVALHRGPYGGMHDSSDIRRAWGPVFDKLGIDLVLQGHDHNYIRSFPMKNGMKVKNGKGTLYLVANTGGVKFYPTFARSWQAVDLQPHKQMYLAVTLNNRKLSVVAYDVSNHLWDAVTLSK